MNSGALGVAPTGHATGSGFRGPQDPPVVCPATGDIADKQLLCDDSGFGKGAGGELQYRVQVPANGARTIWFAVAGSDQGLAAARTQLNAALADPDVAASIDWSKQNLADSVQVARNLRIRDHLVSGT